MRAIFPQADERGVAPVIAEILLVAMAVSIAGVVYEIANSYTLQSSSPSRPFVALGPVTLQGGVATIPITSVSRAVGPGSYAVNLQVGSSLGTPATLPSSDAMAMISAGGGVYPVSWHDVGGEGVVTGGDPITVRSANGPLPGGTTYTFFLLWTDGSVLQSRTWTT